MSLAASETASPPAEPTPDRPLGGLVKHSAIYGAAPVLRQLISIGMTRLYTGWLGTSGSGVKDNADLWVIALQQLLGQNVLAAMVRFFFDHRDEKKRAAVVTSCVLSISLAAALVCGLLLLLVPEITPLLLDKGEQVPDVELRRICELLLVLIPFQLGSLSGFYYLQILKRSTLFTAIQTAKFLLEVSLNIYLIGYLGLGVRGFLLSMLVGEVLTSLGLCTWILWTLRPRWDWQLLRPILVYSAPLIPVGMLQLALHNMDKRMVLHFLGQSEAGIYGFGYKISYLVTTLVLTPFIQTWQPWIFAVEDPGERARLVARVATYAMLSIAVASLGVILFGRQATVLLAGDPQFLAAYQVIPFVAAGYVFWALYNVSQTPLFLAKRTGRLLVVNLFAVLLNFGLNVWLIPIPSLGIVGAALATLGTFAVLAPLGMLASRRSAGVTFEHGRLVLILVSVSLGGALALWVDHLEDAGRCAAWLALVGKGCAWIGLCGLLWLAVLLPEERRRFVHWVISRGRPMGSA